MFHLLINVEQISTLLERLSREWWSAAPSLISTYFTVTTVVLVAPLQLVVMVAVPAATPMAWMAELPTSTIVPLLIDDVSTTWPIRMSIMEVEAGARTGSLTTFGFEEENAHKAWTPRLTELSREMVGFAGVIAGATTFTTVVAVP